MQNPQTTYSTKYAVVFLLFLFTLLFYKYSPFVGVHSNNNSFLQNIFNLYFFISNQTLGIVHESGHGICYLLSCSQFLTVVNGTLFQLFFPLLIYFYYKKKRNSFVAYIGIYFTGFSLQYTAWYISTVYKGKYIAAKESFLGVDGYHDFYYILESMGLLDYYSAIATTVRVLAYILMFGSVWLMFWNAFTQKSRA